MRGGGCRVVNGGSMDGGGSVVGARCASHVFGGTADGGSQNDIEVWNFMAVEPLPSLVL